MMDHGEYRQAPALVRGYHSQGDQRPVSRAPKPAPAAEQFRRRMDQRPG
jgi:hypothetical protein